MAKLTRTDVEKMSRWERVTEEAKRAAEYGITPKRSVSFDPTFSSQESTPLEYSANSILLPTLDEARQNDLDVKAVTTEYDLIPDHIRSLIFVDSPQALHQSIMRSLDALTPSNQIQLLPVIIGKLRDLQTQDADREVINELQQRIARAVFGSGEFEDLKGENGGALPPR